MMSRLWFHVVNLIKRASARFLFGFHYLRLRRLIKADSEEYRKYLQMQLHRTLCKRDVRLPEHARRLIDKTVEFVKADDILVLCVGCRNIAEIDYFRTKGVSRVVGIDLYSENEGILVMDMHSMTFESDSFDVVYSSHSLEHALYPQRAIEEFVRVVKDKGIMAIEVPVNYKTSSVDLVDFRSVDNLLAQFGQHVSQVLWQETSLPGELDCGTEAIRVVFRVKK